MDLKCYLILFLLPCVVLAWNPGCIRGPVGFGHKATGGAGGKVVKPRNPKELANYLRSPQKLVIDLDRVYDFTGSEGWASTTGCFFKKCGAGFQESLAKAGTCNGKPQTTVKYSKAGTSEMIVSSHKTIMSSNKRGVIKGKGIQLKNAQNVIVRDISIQEINPQVIWAGDALVLNGVKDVWVHNVVFKHIGRQHIATFQNSNTGVTISSCLFDGTSKYAAYCDGKHYWTWIFWGTRDEITLINNRIVNTAGRLPHCGGWARSTNYIHMIGNEFDTNTHHGIEPKQGARLLVEGNKFIKFTAVIDPTSRGGFIAMVNTPQQAQECKRYFGQPCKTNSFRGSKGDRFDKNVLQEFSRLDRTAINGARSAVCL